MGLKAHQQGVKHANFLEEWSAMASMNRIQIRNGFASMFRFVSFVEHIKGSRRVSSARREVSVIQ